MKKGEAKKKKSGAWFKILIAVLAVAALAVVIWGAADQFLWRKYDATSATGSKFEKLSKWISRDSDFTMVADVPRMLANEPVRERLALVENSGEEGVAKDLIGALLSRREIIGMLAVVGKFGQNKEEPKVVAIAQGDFKEETLIPSIRAILSAGRSGLAAENVGKYTVYMESDTRDPFGFVLLDSWHMAVGSKDSLDWLIGQNPPFEKMLAPFPGGVAPAIFGRLIMGPRIVGVLPQGMPTIESLGFESADGENLLASIPCADADQAKGLRMFLEGIRSLMLLQEEGNAALVSILKGLAIGDNGPEVTISGSVSAIMDLWGRK